MIFLKEQHTGIQYFVINIIPPSKWPSSLSLWLLRKWLLYFVCNDICFFIWNFVTSLTFLQWPCVWSQCSSFKVISVPLASSYGCGLNIKEKKKRKKKNRRQVFFPLGKENYFWAQRECISGMAYCLVCYNYKQKQFWIGILMTKQIVAYFKPIWIIFLGEM